MSFNWSRGSQPLRERTFSTVAPLSLSIKTKGWGIRFQRKIRAMVCNDLLLQTQNCLKFLPESRKIRGWRKAANLAKELTKRNYLLTDRRCACKKGQSLKRPLRLYPNLEIRRRRTTLLMLEDILSMSSCSILSRLVPTRPCTAPILLQLDNYMQRNRRSTSRRYIQ